MTGLVGAGGQSISSEPKVPDVKLSVGIIHLTNSQFVICKYRTLTDYNDEDDEDEVVLGLEIHKPFIVHFQQAGPGQLQIAFIPFGEIPGVWNALSKFELLREQYWYVRPCPPQLEKDYLAQASGIALA